MSTYIIYNLYIPHMHLCLAEGENYGPGLGRHAVDPIIHLSVLLRGGLGEGAESIYELKAKRTARTSI